MSVPKKENAFKKKKKSLALAAMDTGGKNTQEQGQIRV